MKKSLLLVLLVSHFFGYAQYTLIPDVKFEKALIDLGIDSGTPDGRILTTNAAKVLQLDVTFRGITNLTGIEDFTLLKILYCNDNQLTKLNVTKNTFLEHLNCYFNSLIDLDLSNNKDLTYANCTNNKLLTLNVKNGTNSTKNLSINSSSNPNLICIQVDNKSYSDTNWYAYKDASASYSENCSKTSAAIAPPVIKATGNQIYCPGTSLNIVETISITSDPAEPETDALYIQISSGYISSQDMLTLSNPTAHSKIITSWDSVAGKLKLSSPTGLKIPYTDFKAAIKDIVYSNSSPNPSGTRNFSITIGQANFLPSTGHYYEFVSSIGITWTAAKIAAEASNYYGLKGYLATISSLEEVQISGEQTKGAGWIGGSDAATEGVWKWVTGPEGLANGGTGITFWNGLANGTTPNFAYWNTNEPNQYNGANEDYAHITAPGVGITGSWNDLTISGEPTGNYQPKGYIVEYGGMPGDPILQISASTTITIFKLANPTNVSRCGSGSVILQATSTTGTVNWYDAPSGGNLLGSGNSFTTPIINTTTTYYVDTGCNSRESVIAYINDIPEITSTNSPVTRCGTGTVTLQASISGIVNYFGNPAVTTINWYDSPIGGTLLASGTTFIISNITTSGTFYAEAFNNGCSNGIRVPMDVIVYKPPIVKDQEVTKCNNRTVGLDASVPGMTYLWSTGETTQQITVSTSGIFTVDVTSPTPENCTSRKKITVVENKIPEIERVVVNETTVVIYLKQEEVYFEYSVDGINYQSSNVFFNVPSGLQTAFVREINLCSNDSQTFIVLIAPKYFTPNGDTYNDFWEVKGLNNYPQAEVSIFDRYGKLISVLNITKPTWDGKFNNNLLPADDYWYVLRIDDTKPEKRGHFSLKR
jgi:gliding motility-associated-like protein